MRTPEERRENRIKGLIGIGVLSIGIGGASILAIGIGSVVPEKKVTAPTVEERKVDITEPQVEPIQVSSTDPVRDYTQDIEIHMQEVTVALATLDYMGREYASDQSIQYNEHWYTYLNETVANLKSATKEVKSLTPPDGLEEVDEDFENAMDYGVMMAESFQMGLDSGDGEHFLDMSEQANEAGKYLSRAEQGLLLIDDTYDIAW